MMKSQKVQSFKCSLFIKCSFQNEELHTSQFQNITPAGLLYGNTQQGTPTHGS